MENTKLLLRIEMSPTRMLKVVNKYREKDLPP